MAVTEKDITLCGHGSGTPSTKNMYTYLESRYKSIAPNGKHKGVIAVRRLKKITDSGRKKFHDTYKTILGRNSYNQSLRSMYTLHIRESIIQTALLVDVLRLRKLDIAYRC